METTVLTVLVILIVLLVGAALAARIVKQYEDGVLFRPGRVIGTRKPGLRVIIPLVDNLHRVSLRIVTMPIQSQGIITRDDVSVDVSAVAYFRVVDAVKSVVAIQSVETAITLVELKDIQLPDSMKRAMARRAAPAVAANGAMKPEDTFF